MQVQTYSNLYYVLAEGFLMKAAQALAAKWSINFSVHAIAQFLYPYMHWYGADLP